MNWFFIVTLLFIIASVTLTLIILVQRPSGGGLAGAFGGAGGGGTDTVFGGRVGDALTWGTVITFVLWLGFAVGLNMVPSGATAPPAVVDDASATAPLTGDAGDGTGTGPPAPAPEGPPAPAGEGVFNPGGTTPDGTP